MVKLVLFFSTIIQSFVSNTIIYAEADLEISQNL